MSHSGDFARWPHLGPIRPMARGGHLGPLSYVYGYRGGIGRRSSVEMTPATKLGHQSGDMSSLYGAAWPFLCPNRPFPRWATPLYNTPRASTPGSGSTQPPRVGTQHRAPPRRRPPLPAVRPAGPGGWRRPGRLHAPEAARTGPVSASRSYLSWSPRGRRVNGQNGHFLCQLGRNHVGTLGGRYGSGFNGPRDVLLGLPIYMWRDR